MSIQLGNATGGPNGVAVEKQKQEAAELIRRYRSDIRPFFEQHAGEQLAALDNDAERIDRLLHLPYTVTACFLGHSGIGKSTLLNALAAGRDHILPSGGIGPLTALATEVKYSATPQFSVRYHKRAKLWQLVFGLERSHQSTIGDHGSAVPVGELDEELQSDVQTELDADAEGDKSESRASSLVKQAQQIVTGDQFKTRGIPYLIDALRTACGYKPQWATDFTSDDADRIRRVQNALELAETGRPYERSAQDGKPFQSELWDHAAGFLAPLVEQVEVGWPSDLLNAGVILVDLPGVGIARDSYRQITQKFIRDKARAVILTVDRAGPTGETVELLRSSGYWDRLVGAADDPNSDPCKLVIAVTKVDDVASEEYRNTQDVSPRPKRRDIYARLVADFKLRMKAQITEQLASLTGSTNQALEQARSKARETLLSDLEIHPVSAPEYRKLLLDDDEDRAFLRSDQETGIPDLRARLEGIAQTERWALYNSINGVADRLREAISGELKRLETLWTDRARAAAITEALEKELQDFVQEKRRERDLRVGAFREFLETTSQTQIKYLVAEARDAAEQDVRVFLRRLKTAHWATLRAAVRRGGAFIGTRPINLPEDIAGRFQEPMAGVWSTKLLTEVRKRTAQFASDEVKIVEEFCEWANSKTANSQAEELNQLKQRIARNAAQMTQAGKEAVGDLRQLVKTRIMDVVRPPIKRECEKFVANGDDIGRGVKDRILNLFEELARQATKSAEKPAVRILEDNFAIVRSDIKSAFDGLGDPLIQTADLILQREKQEIEQKSEREREAILTKLASLMRSLPQSGNAGQSADAHAQ
ncbi:dynamin family protein [Tardiphaga sp. 839_C3_N1_4]|uniref:dynamin family protein n=1 Tax=Tardiphaga sp. 839_C3_N1_4 TaxID=3240761 RepID=UPI003F22D6E2